MLKRYTAGTALYHYVIIIALISLALVPILIIFGGQIQLALSNLASSYSSMNKSVNNNVNPLDNRIKNETLKAGDLGGTSTTPVEKCANNVCSIDYGEFVLNGLPENFENFVQGSGTDGGTEVISAMLDQIAEQLKENGDVQGYEDYKVLANLGHFQAQYQKSLENFATGCQSDANPATCMNTKLMDVSISKLNLALPDNLSTVLPDFESFKELSDRADYDFRANFDLGMARHKILKNPSQVSEEFFTAYPAFAAAAKLDKVLNNPNYSDNLKNVTVALLQKNGDLNYSQALLTCDITASNGDVTNISYNDVLTGKEITNYSNANATSSNQLVEDFLHPKTSMGTNLNSSLICVAGKNQSDGRACYK